MTALARARPHPAARRRTPAKGEADYQRGLDRARNGRWEDAIEAFAAAVARNPADSVYWLNLAHARMRCGQFDSGAEAALRGYRLAPASEPSLAVASECLNAAHRHADVVELIAGRDPSRIADFHVHAQLGVALYHLGRYQEASDRLLAALSRKPDFMPGHVDLGNVFNRMELHEEARECFKTAIAVGGDAVQLTSGMTYEDIQACRWDLLAQDLPELFRLMDQGTGYPQPFQLLAQDSTRHQQLDAARRFADRLFSSIVPLPPPAPPAQAPGRIRVGYFSSDLHEHATSYLLAQVLERHDRSRFEIFAYSYGTDDRSPMRRRLEQAVEHFVEVSELSDRGTAERIRADGVDVLIDLKGYTLGARNTVMAFRPAPIQVNYLGFPGTLGAAFYDYIIGDPTVTPLEHGADYAEQIAQMPVCYQPNDRSRPVGPRPTRAECGLPERGFVFASFNSPYKITAEVFDVWCRLLAAVPDSVLWQYESNAQARRNLTREAVRRGIDPARIVWAPPLPQAAHLGRVQLADLVLDTRPVCGHTTTSDALWAGVPVLSCPGQTFVARVAASVLRAAGLEQMIAADLAQYESIALDLARRPEAMAGVRGQLEANRMTCALFDSARYTRDLEALFERMVQRRRDGACGPLAAVPADA